MKKLLMGSVALSCIAVSLTILQLSCSKSEAQNQTASVMQINKLLISRYVPTTTISIANYDGTNESIIPLNIPAGFTLFNDLWSQPKLSPDGQKLFYYLIQNGNQTQPYLYMSNVDGSNPVQVLQFTEYGRISGVY